MKLSRSTAHRQLTPELAALCLAGLRLGITRQVENKTETLDFVGGSGKIDESGTESVSSACDSLSSSTVGAIKDA
jgi:hypothetical protein